MKIKETVTSAGRTLKRKAARLICRVLPAEVMAVFFAGQTVCAASRNSSSSSFTNITGGSSGNVESISNAFGVVYGIIGAIVSAIGQLYLLWGVFEWATALNSQDGTMQSMAFKRIGAGLVACLAPSLITLIISQIQ